MTPPSNMQRILIRVTGLLGFSAIILGAVGTHAVHDQAAQALIEKASLYQLIHAVALLAFHQRTQKAARITQYCWIGGTILFSGSLYLKAFAITASAPLAPFGGVLLMAGWLALQLGVVQNSQTKLR